MMKNFEYLAPKTVKDALTLLAGDQGDSKVIAGGQSLLLLMGHGLVTPKYLIDIKGISSLNYLQKTQSGLEIGSLTTHRSVETSPLIRNGFCVLAQMEGALASLETRNWGTLGGNVCHADPKGDVCPVLIALGAKVKMISLRGERTMAVEDFSTGYFETALNPDELLAEIQVPNPAPRTGTAYHKFTMIEGDYAIVSTTVSITLDASNEKCKDARIVLGAVAPAPMRAKRAEKVLVGREIKDSLLQEAAQIASEEAEPVSDMHASDEYKRELVKVLVKRVGKEALEKAGMA